MGCVKVLVVLLVDSAVDIAKETAASILPPFLHMLPVQILTQNLLCGFSQMGMPFDRVDEEYIKKPRKWETKSIQSFMAYIDMLPLPIKFTPWLTLILAAYFLD